MLIKSLECPNLIWFYKCKATLEVSEICGSIILHQNYSDQLCCNFSIVSPKK